MGLYIKAQSLEDGATPFWVCNPSIDKCVALNMAMADENFVAASLEFDVPTGHIFAQASSMSAYGYIVKLWDGTPTSGDTMFLGRVIQADRKYSDDGLYVHYVCESMLGSLSDSTVMGMPVQTVYSSPGAFVSNVIARHNNGLGLGDDDDSWTWNRVSGGNRAKACFKLNCYLLDEGMGGYFRNDDLGNDENLMSVLQKTPDTYGEQIMRTAVYSSVSTAPVDSSMSLGVLYSHELAGRAAFDGSHRRIISMNDWEFSTQNFHRPAVDVTARHGININDVSASNDLDAVYTCIYATNDVGNEAYAKNDTLVAKYGYRQMRYKSSTTTQEDIQSDVNAEASALSDRTSYFDIDLDVIDLSKIDGGYKRPRVGQLWRVVVDDIGLDALGIVKSCTWSADEPWSSHVVLTGCVDAHDEDWSAM